MSCPRCGDLNLDELFVNRLIPSRQYGFPVAEIEGLSRSCRRVECPVCRFLASSTSLMDTCAVADTWHLRAFDIDTIATMQVQSDTISSKKLVLVLIPGPGDEEIEFDVNESDLIIPIARVAEPASANCVAGPVGRILSHKQVSWDLIRTWLNTCIRDHNPRCTTKLDDIQLRELKSIQVIDCRDSSIVPFDGSDFVALSYCIGPRKRKRGNGSRPGKRVQNKTKVITDAIECTSKLGYRYLWVDQVCIDQDDKASLAENISKMNLIYSQAAFTIVSLAPTQNDGLPGVLDVLRRQQPCLRTATATYVSTMHSLAVAVNRAKWISRAWCYQEALLSKRLLIFSAQQAYFMCNTSHLAEALTYSIESPVPALTGLRRSEYVTESISDNRSPDQDEVEWSFGAWVAAFTRRDITFQNDVLNAFRGILSISQHQSFWGVPFVLDTRTQQDGISPSTLAEAFTRGLSWSTSYNSDPFVESKQAPTTENFYHRTDFPSWSWASCRTHRSPIRYQIPGGFAAEYASHICTSLATSNLEVEIEVERSSGQSVPIAEFVRTQNDTKILLESSRFIYIITDTVNLGLCRIHVNSSNDAGTGFAKFCIRLEESANEVSAGNSITIESEVFEETPNELEDGRFVIDFDKPTTRKSGDVGDLQHEELLGLILTQRVLSDTDENDGEYCIMLVRQSSDVRYRVRVGIVWIAKDHMEILPRQQKRIRLG